MHNDGVDWVDAGAEPGEYCVRIDRTGAEVRSGVCRACRQNVLETDPSVVRYSADDTGGIFHTRCAPTGPQWFGVEGE
jgi:hypothetical protein